MLRDGSAAIVSSARLTPIQPAPYPGVAVRFEAWWGGCRMILTLPLPRILEPMTNARVLALHATEGSFLKPGNALLDLTVDLGSIAPQDCPPVSHYRIALREAAWLRQLPFKPSDEADVGENLAIFSTEQTEPLVAAQGRKIRHMVAGIVADWHDGVW